MKKGLFIIMLLTIGLIYSCADNQANQDNDQLTDLELQTRAASGDFISFNMPFPEGTQFEIIGSSVQFTLPQTHYIVGLDADGQFYQSYIGGTGSVTCECTEGSGCDPITNKMGTGCLMKDGCSKCTKTTSSIMNIEAELVEIAILSNEVDLFIDNFDELHEQYLLPKAFLGYGEVTNILTMIQEENAGNASAETKTVFANVFGYVVLIDVPADSDNTSLAIIGGGDDKISCSCNVSGSCPLETHWTGTKWCNSDNCSKCTMSGVSVKMNEATQEYNIKDGFITYTH